MSKCPFSGAAIKPTTLRLVMVRPLPMTIRVEQRGYAPVTFDNHYLFEKLAHFNRERIPEREVHARAVLYTAPLR